MVEETVFESRRDGCSKGRMKGCFRNFNHERYCVCMALEELLLCHVVMFSTFEGKIKVILSHTCLQPIQSDYGLETADVNIEVIK